MYTLSENDFTLSLIKILPVKGIPSSVSITENFILISSQNIILKFGRFSQKFVGYIESQKIQTILSIFTLFSDQVVVSGRNFISEEIFEKSIYRQYEKMNKKDYLDEVIELYDFSSVV